jgi:uncharacterized lipoprotein YddW (UPF0748 family)
MTVWGIPGIAAAMPDVPQPLLLAQQQSQSVTFGVVRSSDNAADWEGITARLQAAQIPYQVIDLDHIDQVSDLQGIEVLFLPNITLLTSTQVIALGAWLNGGGRLIVSGAVGDRSGAGVQQALQSLLGGYWASTLSEPTSVDIDTSAQQSWLSDLPSEDVELTGGVLMPTGLTSQTVVTWQGEYVQAPNLLLGTGLEGQYYNAAPAVLTTERTTFLGWAWGSEESGSVEFDGSWLRAAVSRFGAVDVATDFSADRNTNSSPVVAESGDRPTQFPIGLIPSTPLDILSSERPPTQDREARALPFQSPGNPAPGASDNAFVPVTPAPPARSPLPLAPALLTPAAPSTLPTADPAEQVAPPGVEVTLGNLPINTLEAIAMQQEMENLIGRFESALLAADLISGENTLNASVEPMSGSTRSLSTRWSPSSTSGTSSITLADVNSSSEALQFAHQVLDTFPDWVANQDYALARQNWVDAQQALWEYFPSDRPLATQAEIRAVWLDRGTIVRAGSQWGLEQIFDRLEEAGINTVFFETVNAGYPIYPSEVAPEQNPLVRNWDPLEAAVTLAHERDMEIHAWVWIFAAGNQLHNALVNQPTDYPGPIITAHPTWANVDNRGEMIPPGQTKPFLDPANPEVRSYLLRLFEEIVTNYDVDGLQLDYIRYPFQDPGAGRTYGYGIAARQQFQQLTGVDPTEISPSDRDLWEEWTEFRVGQVDSFVADTAELLHQLDPNLILSAAVFPMSEHERTHKIQQHWEAWAERGDVDLIVVMSYAMDTNRLQQLTQPWLESDALSSTIILPGIRLLNLSESATLDQIQALRDMPSGGYALFAAENLNGTLQAVFERTQGTTLATEAAIPYREPFVAAAERFSSLQQEWQFLDLNGQLWIDGEEREAWQTASNELMVTLEQLADDPSEQRFAQVQQLVSQFQANFGDWMLFQSLSDGYRVQTWENRLDFLETLLNYGDRFVFQRSTPVQVSAQSE